MTQHVHARRVIRRRRLVSLLSATALAVAMVSVGASAFAAGGGIHDSGIQELDGTIDFTGNTTSYTSTTHDPGIETTSPYDWSSLFTGCTSATDACATSHGLNSDNGVISRNGAACVPGSCTGLIDDAGVPYTGDLFTQGSKDVNDIPGWTCTQQATPPKDQLVNTYASAWTAQSPAGSIATNDTVAFMGLERPNTNGNSNAGFWLFKQKVLCNPATGNFEDGSGNLAKHSNGDVFLVGSFIGGGTNAVLNQYTWTCTQVSSSDPTCSNTGSLTLNNVGSALPCPATTGTSDFFCQVVNQKITGTGHNQVITNWNVTTPWSNLVSGANTAGSVPGPGFLEIGIDLSQALGTPGHPAPCFASFLADTRSSGSSTQAETKNFINGSFPTCMPSTTMQANAMTSNTTNGVAHLGQSVTYTAYESNDGTDPLTSPSVTGTGCTSWTYGTGDTNGNGILDPKETWSFTCTTSYTSAGTKTVTVVGHGLDPKLGNRDVTVCPTADATKICDPDETNTISITVINPSTTLKGTSATVSPAIGHYGDQITYTFYETNNGDTKLTSPSISTDDSNCTSLTTPTAGDTSDPGVLDPGETWTLVCTTSYSTSSTGGVTDANGGKDFTINAVGHGTDPLGADVTFYSNCTTGTISNGKLCNPDEATSQTVRIIAPGTTLRELVSASLTFVYHETNSGDSPISSPSVSSDCAGTSASQVTSGGYNTGDTNTNHVFDAGETWNFTCTKTLSITSGNTASYTDNATGHGNDASGAAEPSDNESDSSSATITNNSPN